MSDVDEGGNRKRQNAEQRKQVQMQCHHRNLGKCFCSLLYHLATDGVEKKERKKKLKLFE